MLQSAQCCFRKQLLPGPAIDAPPLTLLYSQRCQVLETDMLDSPRRGIWDFVWLFARVEGLINPEALAASGEDHPKKGWC